MRQDSGGEQTRIVEKVFEYDDYRAFLRDYFAEQKRLRSFFSHRYFARRAGLSSPSFCLDVVKGKFNLTLKTIPRLIRGLGLRGRAASFFKALVSYNQTRNREERDQCYEELVRIRNASKIFILTLKHHEYFSNYGLSVIRELAAYSDWNGDFRKLGNLMKPAISPNEARAGVEKLVEMGILEETGPGKFRQSHPVISTALIPGAIQRTARREILKRGIDALDTLPPDKRHLSHATVSMSRTSYEEAAKILDDARRRIVEVAVNDRTVEQVYEIVIQAFPVSEQLDKAGQIT